MGGDGEDVTESEARVEPDSAGVAPVDAAPTGADADRLDAEAVVDAREDAVNSVSLLRAADVIDDSRPRSRNAVKYSLNAVSERMSGCSGCYLP